MSSKDTYSYEGVLSKPLDLGAFASIEDPVEHHEAIMAQVSQRWAAALDTLYDPSVDDLLQESIHELNQKFLRRMMRRHIPGLQFKEKKPSTRPGWTAEEKFQMWWMMQRERLLDPEKTQSRKRKDAAFQSLANKKLFRRKDGESTGVKGDPLSWHALKRIVNDFEKTLEFTLMYLAASEKYGVNWLAERHIAPEITNAEVAAVDQRVMEQALRSQK